MTREDIERNATLSPLAKLAVEWLSRQEARTWSARDVGAALGILGTHLADEGMSLRRAGLTERVVDGRHLPLAELHLTPAARDAYAPQKRKNAA